MRVLAWRRVALLALYIAWAAARDDPEASEGKRDGDEESESATRTDSASLSLSGTPLGQLETLQQMQQDISNQELILERTKDFSTKLKNKIKADARILHANEGIFRRWQHAVAKNANRFQRAMANLRSDGESYQNHNKYKFAHPETYLSTAHMGQRRGGGSGGRGRGRRVCRRTLFGKKRCRYVRSGSSRYGYRKRRRYG